MFATADTNLTTALNEITAYFAANISAVISAVMLIVVFMWMLKLALRSFGITSMPEGFLDEDGGHTDVYGQYWGEDESAEYAEFWRNEARRIEEARIEGDWDTMFDAKSRIEEHEDE